MIKSRTMLIPMLTPMLKSELIRQAGVISGGGPAPPVYDVAGNLAFALIVGYASPSGSWMPSASEPSKARILGLVSGRM